jgi:hypothetical protein
MISLHIKMAECLFLFCSPTIYQAVKNIIIKIILQVTEKTVKTTLMIEFVRLDC